MGDCGANLLGLLMGVITVEAAVKTAAVVSFVLPLILLAVPFLDTTFVVLKRLKYRQPIYRPDSEHFHHRMARIGFSSRRTIAYLYAWTLMLAGLGAGAALRPLQRPQRPSAHRLDAGDARRSALIAVAASVYLVYVLEILKFRRLDAMRLRRLRPDASPAEIERGRRAGSGNRRVRGGVAVPGTATVQCVRRCGRGGAEQRVGERQVDEDA